MKQCSTTTTKTKTTTTITTITIIQSNKNGQYIYIYIKILSTTKVTAIFGLVLTNAEACESVECITGTSGSLIFRVVPRGQHRLERTAYNVLRDERTQSNQYSTRDVSIHTFKNEE